MKQVVIAFLCFSVLSARAQTGKIKDIKVGTIILLNVYTQGQTYPLTLTTSSLSADELVFSFDLMGSMSGKFINGKGNFEKGVRFNWDEPFASEERKVPDEQTLLVISRTVLKELKTNKKSAFNDQALVLKDLPPGQEISFGGMQIDAVYAESEDGSTKYWILNNDAYPVILKLTGNPAGIDVEIKDFK